VAEPAPYYRIEDLSLGQTFRWRRAITEADLQATIRLTGDHGGYHVDEAFARRAGFRTLIAPGLLQSGMVTKLGGDLNFLAREITFSYVKPVYAGDTLDAEVTVTAIDKAKRRITMEGRIANQAGETVMTCATSGFLPKPDWGVPDKSPAQ
jgi:3-hydroxybutyryl-CoA dehydratase